LPPLALVGGGFALWTHGRRRAKPGTEQDDSPSKLTADEEARLQRLIATEPAPDKPA
jgi:cytochrome c-type biogenesis protein CcmH